MSEKDVSEIRVKLTQAQNKITRFATLGVEVGENAELDHLVSECRHLRRELNSCMGINQFNIAVIKQSIGGNNA